MTAAAPTLPEFTLPPLPAQSPEPESDDHPLNPQQRISIADAGRRSKRIRGAARVAAASGWTLAIFALLSLVFGIFSLPSLIVGLGLAMVAYNELRGRDRLLEFDSTAAHFLGWNQIGLMSLLIVYSVWGLYSGLTSPPPYAEELRAMPELQTSLGQVEDLYRFATMAVYVGLIVFAVIFQGGHAVYYFSRQKVVEQYCRQTAPWIIDIQRLAAVS